MASERCHIDLSCLLPNPSEGKCGRGRNALRSNHHHGCFPLGICLFPQELRCYNIDKQDTTRDAGIDKRASLVVSFTIPDAAPMPLRGLIGTGSGVSILTFSAYNRLAVHTGNLLRPYGVDLYAANGKTIKTIGVAENVTLRLDGYEIETNFVILDDPMGVEDFLLGSNFFANLSKPS